MIKILLPVDMKEAAKVRAKALGLSLHDYILYLLFKEAFNA